MGPTIIRGAPIREQAFPSKESPPLVISFLPDYVQEGLRVQREAGCAITKREQFIVNSCGSR